jgi:hypothetical protein
MIAGPASSRQCVSVCADSRHRAAQTRVSRVITFIQIALVCAIAANLGWIAGR